MKKFILSLISIMSFTVAVYSNTVAEDFAIVNNWGIGWSVDYEIFVVESKIIGNDTTYTSAATQKVEIVLNDTTPNGDLIFTCKPSVKNRIIDKTGLAENHKDVVDKTDTIPIELLTNKYGVVKNIRNIKDIQYKLKNSGLFDIVVSSQLEKYKDEHKNATPQELEQLEKAFSLVKEQMSSESTIYKSAEEILSLFMHYGKVLTQGEEYVEKVKTSLLVAPNLKLDAVVKTKAEKYQPYGDGTDKHYVEISNVTVFDGNQLASVLASVAKSLYKEADESAILEYVKHGNVSETWTHIIDYSLGVCLHVFYDSTVTVGDCTTKKEIEIRFP